MGALTALTLWAVTLLGDLVPLGCTGVKARARLWRRGAIGTASCLRIGARLAITATPPYLSARQARRTVVAPRRVVSSSSRVQHLHGDGDIPPATRSLWRLRCGAATARRHGVIIAM